jgi:hypothetical protein
MTTWGELLADIRSDLKDTASTKRWSDEALYLWAKDAMRDYSLYFPRVISRLELTADGGSYALPVDLVKDVTVECPKDRYLERRLERPGARYFRTGEPTEYYLAGGRLFPNSSPQDGERIYLTYEAMHALPANAFDVEMALTIPPLDEELIRLYIKAKANEQIRSQQANLDRFKLGSGDRSDNPLEPEVGNLMDAYRMKIAERTRGGIIRLYRPGRLR